MTVTLNDVQAAFIKKIKADTGITSLLKKQDDVRELSWQGTEYSMPNIRVRVDQFRRHSRDATCKLFDSGADIYVFSDNASSMIINDIATKIFNLLDTVSFTDGTTKIIGIFAVQSGAEWLEEFGVWRSAVALTFMAS